MADETVSVRVVGPLEEYAASFAENLRRQGYRENTVRSHLHLVAHLSRWLDGQARGVGMLTGVEVNQFLKVRQQAGHGSLRSARGLMPLLNHLRGLGVVPESPPPLKRAVDALLDRYRGYLVQERGLAALTITSYERVARKFLRERLAGDDLDLSGLSAAEVTQFVLAESQCHSAASAKCWVTGLRSLLQFLYLDGQTPPLMGAVPAVASWRGNYLPRALDAAQVIRLLDSCDLKTTVGQRDLAILTLLVRLGLRGGEVAALQLDDFDWRRGEVIIRGKGDRQERLPLPVDVGEVVSAYLVNARPTIECRHLFLRVLAPSGGITVDTVKSAVREACRRAGIHRVGPHRLRHTAATDMLRAGASLSEVGQVLRHRDLATTDIYARVHRTSLREVVRRWPGVVA
ncbi:MAG TPA: site-specific integrase [Candidatus Dormibacteraeota bacterium]|nr:site-specific integrase [Candidatus Dormibacteraeota bacterium]